MLSDIYLISCWHCVPCDFAPPLDNKSIYIELLFLLFYYSFKTVLYQQNNVQKGGLLPEANPIS